MNGVPDAPPPVAAPRTSRLAIASLICGILGCTGIGAIVGLVLGFLALWKIKKSDGHVTGIGLANAAIGISVLMPILVVVLSVVVGFFLPRSTCCEAERSSCKNHVKQLCWAALRYSNENDGRFPGEEEWPQAFEKSGLDEWVMAEPSNPSGGRAYAMNVQAGGKPRSDVKSPGQTVLFFECNPGTPPAGGKADLPGQPRHANCYVIGFCDGHVESVSPDELARLIWNPNSEKPE